MRRQISKVFSWFARHFQVIAACITIPGIAFAVYSQRQAITSFEWGFRPWLLLSALLLLALGPLFQALSFWDALRALGPRPALVRVVLVWTRSFLLRYSPTGALAFVYRVRKAASLKADNSEILAATAYEQYSALQAGLTLAVGFLFLDGADIPVWGLGLFSLGLLLALLFRPSLLGGRVKQILSSRGVKLPDLLRGRRLLPVLAFNLVAWLSISMGNWLMLSSLAPSADLSFLYFSGVYMLACVVGAIVPMLPGGVGAREGVLILLLSPVMPVGAATLLAVGLRVLSMLSEFIAIGLSELLSFSLSFISRLSLKRQAS